MTLIKIILAAFMVLALTGCASWPVQFEAKEAEKVAPDVTLVDVQMIGAAGRVYMSGTTESVTKARDAITQALEAVVGRDQG
jgi:starvation-inducible outer membrane lipoprotein